MIATHTARPQTIVVIGNGMVGLRFCEKLVELDVDRQYRIVTFCEEPRAAYDRVGLTSFFAHRDAQKLMLARLEWYAEAGIELHLGDRAHTIDRQARVVRSDKGVEIDYDYVVLATGSYPFVPPVPGIDKQGVFVYRTIEDLQRIIEHAAHARTAAVIGGGLLGLEAAKAAYDLGLETHVVEFAPRLMPRQIDDAGSKMLVRRIEALGVHVRLNTSTKAIHGPGRIERLEFNDGSSLEAELLIVSAGIRPRDELARTCGLTVGQRGGIQVDDQLRTSDPHIFAIGEVALHGGTVYGLVAPGYEMAEIVARNLTGGARSFTGTDLSSKLKLMGVEVACFGDYAAPAERAVPLVSEDPFGGTYKKLLFSPDGTRLLGGVLVGDAAAYGTLSILAKTGGALPLSPHELLVGPTAGPAQCGVAGLPDEGQICSCNAVTKAQIHSAIRDQGLDSLADVKKCTRAGTGCGGCVPLLTDLFQHEMKQAGKVVSRHLCEHFAYSRTELFAIIRTKQVRTWDDLLQQYGAGLGCEVCKPVAASILASLWNDNILDPRHETLQDTNDRFLANMQRGGLFSVVPRVPGGEITPEKLIVLGETAQRYGLYTKITGGQRIDLFGAQVQDLPKIWERLVDAGFESGHAYGKALRTVKSCVGTTWCRYGVQDSVGFAIRVENRYKGIRAPHKIKAAVSGCTRECAEAQSKDFGLIATETGYNLHVCGNGGTKPRHAELLAADLDEATALKYVDRFIAYYISTADKLTRTSVWLDKLEGGIDHLREVIVADKLGICGELEALIEHLVATYRCEWAEVVRNPELRKRFNQFVNTDETESCIEIVTERGQQRPADWPSEQMSLVQLQQLSPPTNTSKAIEEATPDDAVPAEAVEWVPVGTVGDFPLDGGATIKYGQTQIAVFNFASRGEWYACQQMCPHKKAFVLSRGIIGDAQGTPKVACPMHKKQFSLQSGECLSGEEYTVRVFPVRVDGNRVLLQLPAAETLDATLATEIGCRLATACETPAELVPA